MTLLSRASRMFSAKIHGWLDHFQQPEQMARQSLRQLEQGLQVAMAATAKSMAAEKLLERQRDDRRRQLSEFERRAAELVRSGDEAAARRVLAQQFQLERILEQLAQRLTETVEVNVRLRRDLDSLRERDRRDRDRVALHVARAAVAEAGQQAASAISEASSTGLFDDIDSQLAELERAALESEARRELAEGDIASIQQEFLDRDVERFIAAQLAKWRVQ